MKPPSFLRQEENKYFWQVSAPHKFFNLYKHGHIWSEINKLHHRYLIPYILFPPIVQGLQSLVITSGIIMELFVQEIN